MTFPTLFFFALTFLIEFAIVSIFIRKDYLKILSYIFLINLFTWPIANLLYGEYGGFYIVEAEVVLVESVLLMLLLEIRYTKSLLISVSANLTSAFLPKFLWAILIWAFLSKINN